MGRTGQGKEATEDRREEQMCLPRLAFLSFFPFFFPSFPRFTLMDSGNRAMPPFFNVFLDHQHSTNVIKTSLHAFLLDHATTLYLFFFVDVFVALLRACKQKASARNKQESETETQDVVLCSDRDHSHRCGLLPYFYGKE